MSSTPPATHSGGQVERPAGQQAPAVGMGRPRRTRPAGLVSASARRAHQPPDRCRQVGGRRPAPAATGWRRYLKSIGRGPAPPGQAKGVRSPNTSSTAPRAWAARAPGPAPVSAIHQRRRHHQPGGQGPVGRGPERQRRGRRPSSKMHTVTDGRPAPRPAGAAG